MFVALASVALLLVWPGHLGLIAAVVVFELSYVLDCADGMLARWRGTASPVGHLLDFLMDELKAFCLLAAVAVRLFLEQKDVRFLLLGLFGLVVLASGIALTTFVRRPEVAGPAPAERGERRGQALAAAPNRGLGRKRREVSDPLSFVPAVRRVDRSNRAVFSALRRGQRAVRRARLRWRGLRFGRS